MKKVKLIVIIFIAVLLLLSVAFQITVKAVNNNIASKVEEELLSIPLPEDTELADSLSGCGKLISKTNDPGMTYQAAILIKSELSLGKLSDYYFEYHTDYNSIGICKTTHSDARLDIVGSYEFENFKNTDGKYYVVTCTGERTDCVPELWNRILDLDIRAYGW